MVSNSAKLDCRTKQHTEFGDSVSNGSIDMARTKVAKKNDVNNPKKHPQRGSIIIIIIKIIVKNNNNNNNNETGSRSPCMRPRSDPPNFGPIKRSEKQTINID